ncbi:MAG: AI-2E family transporter [Actinomyces sp.]|uniref:AI-2E family transporter n=1 Tax=Actinomyces sp. TaxID=29317 RepID=UPI0026DBB5FF|nr:AI-2E family transporter [Actinomyces sp.]MDO4243449.1 AI-2E family transporter [Actinomyces sp.]
MRVAPLGLLRRLRSGRDALDRTIDRAEQARLAALAQQMVYEEEPSSPGRPAEDGSRGRTPSGVLDSLPSWLVRGGVGAWLLLGLLVIISLVFFATSRIVPVFIGVFMALVLTSILQPLVNLFARVMPRYPATFLGLLTALGLVAGLLAYVVSSVTNQWNSLAAQFSDGVSTIVDFLENGPLPVHLTQDELMSQVDAWLTQGQHYVQDNAPTLATEVLSNAGTVVDVFAVLALAVFSTIFFLASGGKMWRWFLNELPSQQREPVHRAAGAGWYTFAGYARGTVILALTDGIMAGVFLQIVGVPLAAPLAVLVFIGAFIPIIGAPAAMLIAMMVALASDGVVTMIVVCLGVAGIGQIEGHILQPLIMGRQVSLHPVVVIIGVAVGTYSAGLLGAIVAVPLISVAWSVYSELHVKDAPVVGELPAYPAQED